MLALPCRQRAVNLTFPLTSALATALLLVPGLIAALAKPAEATVTLTTPALYLNGSAGDGVDCDERQREQSQHAGPVPGRRRQRRLGSRPLHPEGGRERELRLLVRWRRAGAVHVHRRRQLQGQLQGLDAAVHRRGEQPERRRRGLARGAPGRG